MAVVAGRSTRSLDRMRTSGEIFVVVAVVAGCATQSPASLPAPAAQPATWTPSGSAVVCRPYVNVRPMRRVDPVMTPDAFRKGHREVSVSVRYDIASDGATRNVSVVESSPRGVLDDEVIRAVRLWQFPIGGEYIGCVEKIKITAG